MQEQMKKKFLRKKRYIAIFVLLFIFFVVGNNVLAQESSGGEEMTEEQKRLAEEEKEREEERKKTQEEYEKTQEKLEKTKEKLEDHKETLGSIQGKLGSTLSEIRQTETVIETTEETIKRKEGEIGFLEDRIEIQKALLKGLLQNLYMHSQTSLTVSLIEEGRFSKIAQAKDHSMTMQEKMYGIIDEINGTKEKVSEEKDVLEGLKKEKENLLVLKEQQASSLNQEKQYQSQKVIATEATVAELQAKLVELQQDISLLTGKSYTAKNIKEAVEYANKQTGVPKGVLYGFLKMETNLGANTGQCTYKQVKKDAINLWYGTSSKWKASRDLLEKRESIFYDIVKVLGYEKDKKVSCTPRSYRGQGGAMGVAQFMADVWKGYESQIVAQTGHKNPDPWSLTDGVMAMALKLKKAGATSDSESAIRSAAKSYLGTDHAPYYQGIIYWSKNYQKIF
jgi:membrane-bound lytic murein transglycosylase B